MKLRNVSATQVETHTACPRAWHFGWVRGFKTPPTEAMQRGTHIHSGAEHARKRSMELIDTVDFTTEDAIAKTLPANDYAPYVRSMAPYLALGEEKVLVEQKIVLPTGPGLPPWLGYIDLLDDSRTLSPYLRITDHKTTSDFRYAKTPDELANNIQVVSYARYVFENGHDEDLIQVGHLYVKTQPKVPKEPKVLPVFTEIDRPQVDRVWARDLTVVEQMVRDAEVTNTDLLPATGTTNGQCKKYGGCPHRQRCGLSPESGFGKPKGTGTMSSDFLKRLQAAKGGAAAPAPAATPAAAPGAPAAAPKTAAAIAKAATPGKPATGVLPPDAPPRATAPKKAAAPPPVVEDDIEEGAEPTGAAEIAEAARAAAPSPALAAAKARAAAARAEAEALEAVAVADAAALEAAAARAIAPPAKKTRGPGKANGAAATNGHATGFELFIDCMPIKNNDGIDTTLFEDWINPIYLTLNDEVMQAKSLPDFRLLPFAEEKVMLTLAINDLVARNMPASLVVNSSAPGAKDALAVLIPHAKKITRGLR